MASAAQIAAEFDKLFGGNDESSTVTQFLDTGYAPLNHALSAKWDGGAPVGRIIEIFGPESSGKTAISTAIMGAAQKAGGLAGFMDHERSFSTKLAPKLGLDVAPHKFVFKKPRTFEESLTLAVKVWEHVRRNELIDPKAPIAWVFDSLASMVPATALYEIKNGKIVGEKTPENRSMHDNTALARATSAAFPAFAQHCEELNVCALFLNQIRTKLGVMYGDPTTTPGGNAPKFYASIRAQLGASRIVNKTGGEKDVIGSEITARMIKNKVARPFRTATWRFVFEEDGTGKFDVARSMVEFMADMGYLSTAGAYVEFDGKRYHRPGLATKIEQEGLLPELMKLLPSDADTPMMSAAEIEAAEAAERAEAMQGAAEAA